MPLYLCEKEEFLVMLYLDKKGLISCVLCTSVKVTALFLAEKVLSEYWNNTSLLMSLRARFCKGSFQPAKKLINQILLFQ